MLAILEGLYFFFLNSVILNKTLPFPFKGDIWAQRGRQGKGWRVGMGSGRGMHRKNTVPAWDPWGSSPCARLGQGQDMPTLLAVPGAPWDRGSVAKDP